MWYHFTSNIGQSTIDWGYASEYDSGFNPSLALAIGGRKVVEVHNGQHTAGPMWYHLGELGELQ
jgi:hypothetical protein